MKLTAAFLVLCVALLSQCTAAFFMNVVAKPTVPSVPALAPALEAGAGAVESAAATAGGSYFKGFNPLRLILTSMGISVDSLVEGSRKCVTELGPEAVGAVRTLLGALTFFG